MLQKADDQKDDDHQEAEYTIAKFELITPPESPLAILLLHIIQLSYPTKTPEQDLAYRHNNTFKGASIGILDVHRCNTNCGILDAHRCNDPSKILNALRI
jgi:hypothetical protein